MSRFSALNIVQNLPAVNPDASINSLEVGLQQPLKNEESVSTCRKSVEALTAAICPCKDFGSIHTASSLMGFEITHVSRSLRRLWEEWALTPFSCQKWPFRLSKTIASLGDFDRVCPVNFGLQDDEQNVYAS